MYPSQVFGVDHNLQVYFSALNKEYINTPPDITRDTTNVTSIQSIWC
ncbi:hypothetical protein NSIN_20875 [Nitrosotalea sinensis]|uniref:Uncharacterized protein n=1 Tax=Nitrosotalea sinensis TaxID=1499975 RepID=A0A2H1EH72_9ARCH|nr:hypothetical protein [Candidatus Nitrosotalea sinensis]SHO46057.1 hypothetical protein NSIN_20875 [Candidatus Nitrosotalea sinensis]